MEYRLFFPVLDQVSPEGSLHRGFKNGIVWQGDDLTQLEGYDNRELTAEEMIVFLMPMVSTEQIMETTKRLLPILFKQVFAGQPLTQQNVDDFLVLVPYFSVGKEYAANEMLRYEYKLYNTLSAHLSTVDVLPGMAETPYTEITVS